jgi:hypothetical protein
MDEQKLAAVASGLSGLGCLLILFGLFGVPILLFLVLWILSKIS